MRTSTIRDAAREAARETTEPAFEQAIEQAQIDQLRERLAPVVEHAIRLAREQAAHATIAAGHARGWAAPRVDAARDRILADLLPRIVEAVHHAAVVGSAARAAATDTVSRTVEEAARSLADATPTAKAALVAQARVARRRRRVGTVLLSLAAALVSAGVTVALRRARARQADTWETVPTGVPADSATSVAPETSAMDIIAAASGPSDAGVVEPRSVEEAAPEPAATGETSAGPETIDLDAEAGEAPTTPRSHRH